MSWIRTALIAALIGLCAGCGGVARPAAPPVPPRTVGAALPHAEPVHLRIAAIDASSSLVPLGLNPDQTVAVPPVEEPMQAGWYRYGPTPGELGPAVILGHVNGGGQDGIFARLHEMGVGDEVVVDRGDGTTAVFGVTRITQVPKSEFPTGAVYGNTDTADLRLITCGGSFDSGRDSYRDNIIVFATLIGSHRRA